MGVFLHLLIHFSLSVFAGFLIGNFFDSYFLALIFAILGGFLIDIDHVIDYFLAFGFKSNWADFSSGKQFLVSDKIYVLFHGWEYVIIGTVLCFFIENDSIRLALLSFNFSLFLHLCADCFINYGVKARSYSILYRIKNNFEIKELVKANNYKKHLKDKKRLLDK